MVKVTPWQCPSSAPVPPQRAPGGSGRLAQHSQGEASPLGAQALPRVLELAASKAAHFPAFDHPGGARRCRGAAPRYARERSNLVRVRGRAKVCQAQGSNPGLARKGLEPQTSQAQRSNPGHARHRARTPD